MCKQSGLLGHQNTSEKVSRKTGYFDERKYIEKSTWKLGGFFDHQNYIVKSTWKQREFFDQRNYFEKLRGNNVEIR